MSIDLKRFSENLNKISLRENVPFMLSQTITAGMPAIWEEEIYYEAGKEQKYKTVRDIVDQGGIPIGQWRGEASVELMEELFAAFRKSEIWKMTDQPPMPDQETTVWSFRVGEDSGKISFESSHPDFTESLSDLNMLMRRIVYYLTESHSGAELKCLLDIQEKDGVSVASVILRNTGTMDCVIPNPLNAIWDDLTYLNLEVAKPDDPEKPTGLGLAFEPLPLKVPDDLDEKWDEAFLELKSQDEISFPVEAKIDRKQMESYWIRAVFSDYRVPFLADSAIIVLKGRVFSKEEIL